MGPETTATGCPVTNAMKVIGGKWKLPIIFNLGTKTYRFGELKRVLTGITQQMLSKQLKELEDHGMVGRKVYAEVPPRVEYSLTEKGKSTIPVMKSIAEWSENHLLGTK
jgi:DNA-binding HxlR family transcriptional regulator